MWGSAPQMPPTTGILSIGRGERSCCSHQKAARVGRQALRREVAQAEITNLRVERPWQRFPSSTHRSARSANATSSITGSITGRSGSSCSSSRRGRSRSICSSAASTARMALWLGVVLIGTGDRGTARPPAGRRAAAVHHPVHRGPAQSALPSRSATRSPGARSIAFAVLNIAGLVIAIVTGHWYLKQIYRAAYFPIAGTIWLLGALGLLPRVKRSTKGEGHERRYFYGSVWAVCWAQPALWLLWKVLPQHRAVGRLQAGGIPRDPGVRRQPGASRPTAANTADRSWRDRRFRLISSESLTAKVTPVYAERVHESSLPLRALSNTEETTGRSRSVGLRAGRVEDVRTLREDGFSCSVVRARAHVSAHRTLARCTATRYAVVDLRVPPCHSVAKPFPLPPLRNQRLRLGRVVVASSARSPRFPPSSVRFRRSCCRNAARSGCRPAAGNRRRNRGPSACSTRAAHRARSTATVPASRARDRAMPRIVNPYSSTSASSRAGQARRLRADRDRRRRRG